MGQTLKYKRGSGLYKSKNVNKCDWDENIGTYLSTLIWNYMKTGKYNQQGTPLLEATGHRIKNEVNDCR